MAFCVLSGEWTLAAEQISPWWVAIASWHVSHREKVGQTLPDSVHSFVDLLIQRLVCRAIPMVSNSSKRRTRTITAKTFQSSGNHNLFHFFSFNMRNHSWTQTGVVEVEQSPVYSNVPICSYRRPWTIQYKLNRASRSLCNLCARG